MSDAKRGRGRPVDGRKTQALLNAARELLLSVGPDVTTDQIAAAAGVSKSTLYKNFQDKNGLIEAVIRREADLTMSDDEFSHLLHGGVCVETIQHYGIRYMTFLNSRDIIRWDRLISSLSTEQPDLPKRFFDLGPGRGQKRLAELLRHASEAGHYRITDATAAADILAGLWLGFASLEVKLGVREPLGKQAVEDRVRSGLGHFQCLFR